MKEKVFNSKEEGIAYYTKKIEKLEQKNSDILQTGVKGMIARFNLIEFLAILVFSLIFMIIFNLIADEDVLLSLPTAGLLIIICLIGSLTRKKNVDSLTLNNNMRISRYNAKIEELQNK